jgi:mannose-6-phosphate isomerase
MPLKPMRGAGGMRRMCVTSLAGRPVEKIWGRRHLPDGFGAYAHSSEPTGEIWFEHPTGGDPELLVKYLFTSERLSIQVHPDDGAAQAAGQAAARMRPGWCSTPRQERSSVLV